MIKRTAPLLAALLMGTAGVALAQGNPPNTSSPNPATGAGQQTQQGTPMGTTGTPSASQGTGAGTMSGSTGGATTSQSTTSPGTGTGMANQGGTQNTTRMARADRN